MSFLEQYARGLKEIFKRNRDHYRSHEMSRRILREMAQDPHFLKEVIDRHLASPQNYNRPHFPLPGMTVVENAEFTCYVHFWFGGMPQRDRGQSVTCVHHHGTLLLTTAAIHGPGCEVWIFSRPREMEQNGCFNMDHYLRHQNSVGSFTFIDTGQPHLIFPPEGFSVTVALWSRTNPSRLVNTVKHHPWVRKNKSLLLKMSKSFGLNQALEINEVVNFDFIPLKEGFRACPERLQYPYAPNEDYLVNLFHILKVTGSEESVTRVQEVLRKSGKTIQNELLVRELSKRLERGEEMAAKISESHRYVSGLNVTREEVWKSLGVADPEGVPLEGSIR